MKFKINILVLDKFAKKLFRTSNADKGIDLSFLRKSIPSKYIILIILFIFCLGSLPITTFTSFHQKDFLSKLDNPPFAFLDSNERITIITAGDIMSHLPQNSSAWDTACKCFNFSDVYKYISPVIKKADIAFANFETTNGGLPYSGFPRFSSPDTIAWFLKNAGFDFFVNSNNHSIDKGIEGICRTLDIFDSNNIMHTGVFRDTAERKTNYPFILKNKGFKIAVLNYTYGTNNIETPFPTFVNRFDTIIVKKDLQCAVDSSTDIVAVFMHWGVEYQRYPNNIQRQQAEFLFRNGADIIIGSHPHVIQPLELINFSYKGKSKQGLVIWSLGNFISNQRKRFCDGGILAKFDVLRNFYNKKIKIENISYIPFWVYKSISPVKYYILPISAFEKDTNIFNMPLENKQALKTFINDTRFHLQRDTANIKESN